MEKKPQPVLQENSALWNSEPLYMSHKGEQIDFNHYNVASAADELLNCKPQLHSFNCKTERL